MLRFFVIVLFGSLVGVVITALKSPAGEDIIPTAVAAFNAATFMLVWLESNRQSK